MIFDGIASKLEKVGPALSGFNPPNPSFPFVATDRKEIQCLKIIFNNKKKTGPLYLEFDWCENSFSFSKKKSKQLDIMITSLIQKKRNVIRSNYICWKKVPENSSQDVKLFLLKLSNSKAFKQHPHCKNSILKTSTLLTPMTANTIMVWTQESSHK